MIPLMSSWQPPHPVPARVAPETSATVPQPPVTAAAILVPLTPAHRHTVRSGSAAPDAGRLVRAVQAQQQRPVRRELGAALEQLHQLGRRCGACPPATRPSSTPARVVIFT